MDSFVSLTFVSSYYLFTSHGSSQLMMRCSKSYRPDFATKRQMAALCVTNGKRIASLSNLAVDR